MQQSMNIAGRDERTARAAYRSPRAFTLLEIVVVITMIAIMAGVLLPRLAGQTERLAESEAIAVQRLLGAAAERASLIGGQRTGIEFTTIDGVASLAVVTRVEPGDSQNRVAGRRSGGEWKQDLLVEPVVLSNLEITQATVDGRKLDPRTWLVPIGSAQVRPAISIVLGPHQKRTATAFRIDLLPDSLVAARTAMAADQVGVSGSRALSSGPSRSIDLDATGRGDSPW